MSETKATECLCSVEQQTKDKPEIITIKDSELGGAEGKCLVKLVSPSDLTLPLSPQEANRDPLWSYC